MTVMEALTKLVVGMSRLGDHLLRHKVSGVVVAALAFACGAGLVYALGRGPTATPAAPTATSCGAPDLAEVSIGDTPAAGEEEDAVFDEGRYEDYVYGYSVEIPSGMVGLGPTPPAPQHGFGIDLDNPRSTAWGRGPEFPNSYVSVDGSHNSMEYAGPEDAVNYRLSFLREKGRNVRVLTREGTHLGGLPAVRVVARYERDGVEMVSDEIVAFAEEASPVYTLSLSTPLAKYERDRPVLEALRRGWCLQPVE